MRKDKKIRLKELLEKVCEGKCTRLPMRTMTTLLVDVVTTHLIKNTLTCINKELEVLRNLI